MSDFLVNVARRGAGLAPIVAVRPPFVPTFAPDIGTARPAEPETVQMSTGGHRPVQPVQARGKSPSSQARTGALSPQPKPARATASPLPIPVPTRQPASSNNALPEAGAPSTSAGSVAELGKEVETALSAAAGSQAMLSPRHPQPPAPIAVPMPAADPTAQVPVAEHLELEPGHPPMSPMPPAEAEVGPLLRPAVIHLAPTQEAYDRSVNYPQPAIQQTSQLANQPSTQPTIYPAIQPTIAAERLPMLPKPGVPTAAPLEPRPIQVRIGAVEVRATTPPTPAPSPSPAPTHTPGGFDTYASIRTYASWETD